MNERWINEYIEGMRIFRFIDKGIDERIDRRNDLLIGCG